MKRLWNSRALRRLGLWSLGLSLGATAGARAGEVEWRPVAGTSSPAAVLEKPRPLAPAPAVRLERPKALAPAADPLFRPASLTEFAASVPQPVVRAQATDGPRVMPIGPEGSGAKAIPKGAEAIPAPKGGPVMSGPIIGAPVLDSNAPIIVHGAPMIDGGACFAADGSPCGSPAGEGGACLGGHDRGGWLGHALGGWSPAGWFNGLVGQPDGGGAQFDHRFWLGGEYLLWWMKGSRLPPLVTTGNPNDPLPGALFQPGTQVLFGGGTVDSDTRSGARFRAGYWFDDEHTIGLDGSFFFLGQRATNFVAGSNGAPALYRPFFDVDNNRQDAEVVSESPVFGAVGVSLVSRVWGAEANLRTNLVRNCWFTLDALAGFRYFALDETLDIREDLTDPVGGPSGCNPGTTVAPARFLVHDQFQARNRFYGGQVGLEAEMRRGRWSLDLRTKVALGNTHEIVTISGGTLVSPLAGGTPTTQVGGLLAQASNIGRYSRDRFAVMPELGLKVGYQVTNHLTAFVGYDFTYLSNVARPGNQVDLGLNAGQLCGLPGTRPAFAFKDTDFWVHGVNFGLEFRY